MKDIHKIILAVIVLGLLVLLWNSSAKTQRKEGFVTNIEQNGTVTVIYDDGRKESFPSYSQYLQGQYRKQIAPWHYGSKCVEGFEADSAKFGTCPDGWTYLGQNRCAKPDADSSNLGLCSEDIVDFSGYSDDMKRDWSTQCSVTWANRKQLQVGNKAPFIERFQTELDTAIYGEPILFIDSAIALIQVEGQQEADIYDVTDVIANLIKDNEIDADINDTNIAAVARGTVQQVNISVQYVSFDKGYIYQLLADPIGTSRISVKKSQIAEYYPSDVESLVRRTMIGYLDSTLLDSLQRRATSYGFSATDFVNNFRNHYKYDSMSTMDLFQLIGRVRFLIGDYTRESDDSDVSRFERIVSGSLFNEIDKMDNIYEVNYKNENRDLSINNPDMGGYEKIFSIHKVESAGIDSQFGNPSQYEIEFYDMAGFDTSVLTDDASFLRFITVLTLFLKIFSCAYDSENLDFGLLEIAGIFLNDSVAAAIGVSPDELNNILTPPLFGNLSTLSKDQTVALNRLSKFVDEMRCSDLISRANANNPIKPTELSAAFTIDTLPKIFLCYREVLRLQSKCYESKSLTEEQFIRVVKYLQSQIENLSSVRFGEPLFPANSLSVTLNLFNLLSPFEALAGLTIMKQRQEDLTIEELQVILNVLMEANKLDCQTLLKRAESNTNISITPTPTTPSNQDLTAASSGLITTPVAETYELRRSVTQKYLEWELAFRDSCDRLNITRTGTEIIQDKVRTAAMIGRSMTEVTGRTYNVPENVVDAEWLATLTLGELKVLLGVLNNLVSKCDQFRTLITDSASKVSSRYTGPTTTYDATRDTLTAPVKPISKEQAIAADTSFLTLAGDIGKYLQDTTVRILLPGDASIMIPNGSTKYEKTVTKCDKNGGATETKTTGTMATGKQAASKTQAKSQAKPQVCTDPAAAGTKPGDSNFAFKPKYGLSHMEPTKEWADSYGWSFMPPQYWSVPQQRPPVCIPDKDTEATIQPAYTQGTPLDALDWNQPPARKPAEEYKRNDNYYYPGWVAQDSYSYPFSGSTAEYYNLNKATSTKKP